MQNVGFAFSLSTLLRRAAKSREAYLAMMRRHLQYFNTHPYFAPVVLGVVFHKESSRSEQEQLVEDPGLTVLKESMGNAFGAIGDHVVWGTWRPFCAILAIGVGLLVAYPVTRIDGSETIFNSAAGKMCARWWVWGFLGLFNLVHVWLRWRGLQKACHEGPLVVGWIQSLSLQAWAAQLRRVALLLLAVMALFYLSRWSSAEIMIWMIAVLLGTIIMKRWALSSTLVFYGVCAVSVAMTFIGIHWP
jgi:hypothetical protein